MALKEYKPEKMLYTMGEVTEMFDVKPSLIRFWEQRFDILKPQKNKKGNRLFTPSDIKNLEVIYHLTKERGMTLSGVEKYLKNNKENAEQDTEIVKRLQTVHSLLLEIREELREEPKAGVPVFVSREEPKPDLHPGEAPAPDFWEEEPQALPGEIVEEEIEEEIEEIDSDGFDGFTVEEDSFDLKTETDERDEAYPVGTEETVDEEVSVPFIAQPLFDLDETVEIAGEETCVSGPEEEKPSVVDTQQSLF